MRYEAPALETYGPVAALTQLVEGSAPPEVR
jgi:hypothetical protein